MPRNEPNNGRARQVQLGLPSRPVAARAAALVGRWSVVRSSAPSRRGSRTNKATVNPIANSTKPLIETAQEETRRSGEGWSERSRDMFRKLENKLNDLQKDTKLDTKQSMAKLNDIKAAARKASR